MNQQTEVLKDIAARLKRWQSHGIEAGTRGRDFDFPYLLERVQEALQEPAPAVLTARDYQDGIDVQDACNLSGVVFAFARAMEKICNEARANPSRGTEWKNNHPLAIMYAAKIASLTCCEFTKQFSDADTIVRAVAAGKAEVR